MIDLNADVGEGMAIEEELLALVSSCNIACGGHIGDDASMARSVAAALNAGVVIGAHPSYEDRAHFGRQVLDLTPQELGDQILRQLEALALVVARENATLAHVKPHGALYNQAARDPVVAAAVARAVAAFDPSLALVGLAGSLLLTAGRTAGLKVIAEGFVDRAYEADGSLRDRRKPDAVHVSLDQALHQALAIAQGQHFPAHDGSPLLINAQTLCIHSDTPHALHFAQALRQRLADASIAVAPPTPLC